VSRLLRVPRLAVRLSWASRARFVLLTLISATGMTVFLIVLELSAVSSQGLNQAIELESGQAGTYAIDVTASMGLTAAELAEQAGGALRKYATRPPMAIELLPAQALDCPPLSAIGSQPVVFVLTGSGQPAARLPGRRLPSGTQVCVGGQHIPAAAVRIPTASERFDWLGITPDSGDPATGVVMAAQYAQLAELSAGTPAILRLVIVTNRQQDESSQLQDAVDARLSSRILAYGMAISQGGPGPPVSVTRLDSDQAIRNAASGVDVVYTVIAWGVLAIGGLGLLVAQMIVVRDRRWLFGLARAVGGTATDVAALIITDTALILGAGTAVSLLLALMLQPVAAAFAFSTFQISGVSLVRGSVTPELVAGELLILLLAGAYPAIRAVREDPLDVLEPQTS
jgi:hypothetical protein